MKVSSIILSVALLWNNAHSGTAHEHHHDLADHHHHHHHHHHNHDEAIDHSHFHHDHDYAYRGLRVKDLLAPMNIGNHTYASKHEFIRSGHRCGSRKASGEKLSEMREKLSQWMTDSKHRMDQTTNVVVSTYFHIITSGRTGAISNATITSQLSVLNTWYKAYGFSFKLVKTTRTSNTGWYNAVSGSSAEAAMFKKLRVGGSSTLNVYFNAADGYLGYATLPVYYDSYPKDDGVVIASGSVPGGSLTSYNQGKTLVHEVGHWLGLSHTFDTDHSSGNGCNGNGDFVSDTPKQRYPTEGCPARQDSCPLSSGLDMVSNFMDYSDDACMSKFTTGQKNRMRAMWDAYRA